LLAEGLSADEVGAEFGISTDGERELTEGEGVDFPVINTFNISCPEYCFADAEEAPDFSYPGDLGTLIPANEMLGKLTNIGDVSPVFTAQNGNFTVMRLEGYNDGLWNSWEEMLDTYKKEYAYNFPPAWIENIKITSGNIIEALLGIPNAYAACYGGNHVYNIELTVYDANGTPINGNGVSAKLYGGGDCNAKEQIVTASNRGAVDCGATPPNIGKISATSNMYIVKWGLECETANSDGSASGCFIGGASNCRSGYITPLNNCRYYEATVYNSQTSININLPIKQDTGANDLGQNQNIYGAAGHLRVYLQEMCWDHEQGVRAKRTEDILDWNVGPGELPLCNPDIKLPPKYYCQNSDGNIVEADSADGSETAPYPPCPDCGPDTYWCLNNGVLTVTTRDKGSLSAPYPTCNGICYLPDKTMVGLPNTKYPTAVNGGNCNGGGNAPCANNPCCLPAGVDDITLLPPECTPADTVPEPQGDGQLSVSTQITSGEFNYAWQNNDIKVHYPIRTGNTAKAPTPTTANADPGYVKFKHDLTATALQQTIAQHNHVEYYSCKVGDRTTVCQRTHSHAAQTLIPTTKWNTNLTNQNTTLTDSRYSGIRVPVSGQNSFQQANYSQLDIAANQEVPAIGANRIQLDQVNNGSWCQDIQASANETVYGTTVYGHTNSAIFSKDVSSSRRCYSAPLLFNLKPHVSTSYINADDPDTIEPGETVRATVGVYAAYNKQFNSCNPGVQVEQWYTIDGGGRQHPISDGRSGTSTDLSSDIYSWSQCHGDEGNNYMELDGSFTETLPVGTKVCFYKRVSSYTNDPYIYRNNNEPWLHIGENEPDGAEARDCTTVTKRATLQINGADSWSGAMSQSAIDALPAAADKTGLNPGGFYAKNSSNSYNACKQTGSWSQYGLFTIGNIDANFGSAGFLYQPNCAAFPQDTHERLKFSNTTTPFRGQFSSSHQLTRMRDYYEPHADFSNTIGATLDLSSLTSEGVTNEGIYNYTVIDTAHDIAQVTLTASSPINKRLILIFDRDVYIDSDIKYADDMGSIYDIPSLTVISQSDIIINPGVHRIDGIYNAENTFHDCGKDLGGDALGFEGSFASGRDECRQIGVTGIGYPNDVGLVVNGAIIANNTRFQRTNGTNTVTDNTPAELIRYNPTVYLSDFAYKRTQQKDLRTILRREIAPRW
jgi:hypothetical protein